MKFFYLFLMLTLILVVVSGCKEKTQVIVLPQTEPAVIQQAEVPEEESLTESEEEEFEEVIPPEETEGPSDIHELEAGEWQETAERILSVMDLNVVDCDETQTTLGFKSCYRDEINDNIILLIKNSGRGTIDELLYVIEDPNRKMNFELAEGMYAGESKLYTINLVEWEQEYGKVERILITPRVFNGTDTLDCVNRQLLLIPAESCYNVLS